MGMFDTVYFENPIACVVCQAPIISTQTKAFDCTLDNYRVGDCIAHAEETRIVRENLHCDACHTFDQQYVYLAVYRGILVDIALDLTTAEAQLRTFSFERLILWHHDLYAKRMDERRERLEVVRFLHEVAQWYEEGYDQMSQAERDKHWTIFFSQRPILESAASPLVAFRAYLDQQSVSEEATSAD
jgi:hypothetical protein